LSLLEPSAEQAATNRGAIPLCPSMQHSSMLARLTANSAPGRTEDGYVPLYTVFRTLTRGCASQSVAAPKDLTGSRRYQLQIDPMIYKPREVCPDFIILIRALP
jgi:hypothetical protein